MFCLNCGKEIEDNSTVCEYCGIDLKEAEKKALKEEKLQKQATVKEFILKVGRVLVDIDTWLGISAAFIVMIVFWLMLIRSFMPDDTGYFEAIKAAPLLLILSIVLPIIIIIAVVIAKYIIYLLIDIRDSLNEIKQQKNEDE